MQAATRKTLQLVLQASTRQASRACIAPNKHIRTLTPYICAQCFHSSQASRNDNANTKAAPEAVPEPGEVPLQRTGSPQDPPDDTNKSTISTTVPPEHLVTTAEIPGGDPNGATPPPRRPGRPPGSRLLSSRRIGSTTIREKSPALPKVTVPDWFYEHSVFLPQDLVDPPLTIRVDINPEKMMQESAFKAGYKMELARRSGSPKLEREESKESRATEKGSMWSAAGEKSEKAVGATDSSEVVEATETNVPAGTIETSLSTDAEADISGKAAESPELVATTDITEVPPPALVLETSNDGDKHVSSKTEDTKPPSTSTLDAPTGWDRLVKAVHKLEVESKVRYGMRGVIYQEVSASIRGGLSLPKANSHESFAALKSHTVLLFPQEEKAGGTYFLDSVIMNVARDVKATLIRIDPQDLEEIIGDHLGDTKQIKSNSAFHPFSIRSLGYDTQLQHHTNKHPDEITAERNEAEANEEEEDIDDEDPDDADDDHSMMSNQSSGSNARPFSNLQSLLSSSKLLGAAVIRNGVLTPINPFGGNKSQNEFFGGGGSNGPSSQEKLNEQKVTAVLSALIGAGEKKSKNLQKQETAAAAAQTSEVQSSDASTESSAVVPTAELVDKLEKQKIPSKSRTIIQVRDYRELDGTTAGAALLGVLHSIVAERRKAGQEIVIVGSSSLQNSAKGLNANWLRHLQSSPEDGMERTIVVPPEVSQRTRAILEQDRHARIREVNLRHLKDLLRRRSGDKDRVTLEMLPDPSGIHVSDPQVDEYVWSFDKVHRMAMTLLGAYGNITQETKAKSFVLNDAHISGVVRMLEDSDAEKLVWSRDVAKLDETLAASVAGHAEKPVEDKVAARIAKLTKGCTTHEKKLLGGVVNPESITVGFSNVIQPAETVVDPLRILTSLSLIRPEAFSYGVLASDRIPGVLLYGPPGTGKTMLAKAVAKESGATVLEVSGSEVFDMYVGEGEKNVKAIFSLAKKLSPCVVFIDEADAIFGSRHSHSTRTTHRELINQFLKEWDGMSHTSAFIMVATNRPFDLDDAVLRRLPRRILVDLPTESERLEILKMHLSSEHLSSDVDLPTLASPAKTNLYSGSDLKNLAVAAALSCVKEENERFKDTGTYPDKRTLEQRHFDKALTEISASISEDMGTLGQIRKFDEKYGEKSGRKKKSQRWGFGSVAQVEDPKEKGTGRVRT